MPCLYSLDGIHKNRKGLVVLKRLKISGGILLGLLAIFVIGFKVYFDTPLPQYTGIISVPGLKEPVDVFTD